MTRPQVVAYEQDGCLAPITVLTEEEVGRYRALFDELVDAAELDGDNRPARERARTLYDTHRVHHWYYELATRPRILDAVESVIGPNLMIWMTNWFPKYPGDNTHISWHQDGLYWTLQSPNVVTAWIALTESTEENGCLQVLPGSHNEQLPHTETYARDNALSRGQEIAVDISGQEVRNFVLNPGQMSLHHVGLAHGSNKNVSRDSPRIGYAVRFASTDVVAKDKSDSDAQTAMLVRGHDEYGHFDLIDPPVA
ncbi:phytanoyl-CoA dioxygenase family protein [Nocardia africana]|uniref:Phytanoyl-CoA dioxygenase family protein n=1 Tax=Nocardia africana TaxID=134964 RepID=A0ABW6NRP3_9NOCA